MEVKLKHNKVYNYFSLNLLIFLIFAIINLTPYFFRRIPMTINIILLLLWVITAIFSNLNYFSKLNKVTAFVTLWILYLLITQFIGFADKAIGNLLHYLVFWYSIVMYDFYAKNLNEKQIKITRNIILITMIISIFFNIYELVDKPYLSKYITGGVLSSEVSINSNVGNYSYVLIVNIVMMTLIHLFFESNNRINKIFFLFSSISCFYMVVLASSMIGLLSNIIMIITYLYLKISKHSLKRKILLISCTFIIILSSYFLKDNIYICLINFANSMENVLIKERFLQLIYAIFGKADQISFSGREILYKYSINTFLNNLFIGVGRRHTDVNGVISLHSQILDDAAYFGTVGIIIQSFILFYFYKTHLYALLKTSGTNLKALISSIIAGTVFYALFNPMINMNSGLMLFVFFPLFCKSTINMGKYLKKGNEKNV